MKRSIAAITILTCAVGTATHLYAADDNKQKDEQGKHHMGNFDPSAKAADHLKRLKGELKITAAQEPAWQTFAHQVQQNADAMKAAHANAKPQQNLSAPDRMNKHIEMSKQRLVDMQKTADVFAQLYNVLTPEQKSIADKHAARFGHDHKGMHHQDK